MARMFRDGSNEDGTPHYRITAEPGEHVLLTGPVEGTVVVDGEEIDVSPRYIVVDSLEKSLKVSDAIGERYEVEGHPGHAADGVPFVHTPSRLSHNRDGSVKDSFTAAVEAAAPAGADSSPAGVINTLTKKKG